MKKLLDVRNPYRCGINRGITQYQLIQELRPRPKEPQTR
jgi:hypothetical protein